jgi:hypothetical protein
VGRLPLSGISPAAEDGISPKPVQFPTERARIEGKTSWLNKVVEKLCCGF